MPEKKHIRPDSLRGYGHTVHVVYDFTCQYCGYDGRAFPNWFQLTVDHILPIGQGGDADDPENMITACQACNSITSRMQFPEGASREKIIEAKRVRVRQRQAEYFEFWREEVAPLYIAGWSGAAERNK